jgi:hypothetical protein
MMVFRWQEVPISHLLYQMLHLTRIVKERNLQEQLSYGFEAPQLKAESLEKLIGTDNHTIFSPFELNVKRFRLK